MKEILTNPFNIGHIIQRVIEKPVVDRDVVFEIKTDPYLTELQKRSIHEEEVQFLRDKNTK